MPFLKEEVFAGIIQVPFLKEEVFAGIIQVITECFINSSLLCFASLSGANHLHKKGNRPFRWQALFLYSFTNKSILFSNHLREKTSKQAALQHLHIPQESNIPFRWQSLFLTSSQDFLRKSTFNIDSRKVLEEMYFLQEKF